MRRFLSNYFDLLFKSVHFLNLATITSVNFAVSAHTLTSKHPAPLPPIVHSKLDYCNSVSVINFQTINLTGFNKSKTLLLVLLLRLLNPHTSLPFSNLHWLKINKCIEYKILSLTKFLQLLNLAIFITLSLFNLHAVPTPHLLSHFSPANHLLENHRSLI